MALIMVLLVVVYFAGAQHRWIRLPIGELQPSEFAKPALVVFLAYFIALRSCALNSKYTLLPAILAVGFLTFAVVVADLGTAIVLVLTAAVVFFVAGLEMRYIGFAAIVDRARMHRRRLAAAVPAGARGALRRPAVQTGRQDRQAWLDSRADEKIGHHARTPTIRPSRRKSPWAPADRSASA